MLQHVNGSSSICDWGIRKDSSYLNCKSGIGFA